MRMALDESVLDILERKGPLAQPELEREVLMLGHWWGKSEVSETLGRLSARREIAVDAGGRWRKL